MWVVGGFFGYGGSVWVMGGWAVGQWIVGVTSFGLCGLKCHIVEIWRDVTLDDGRTTECEDRARILETEFAITRWRRNVGVGGSIRHIVELWRDVTLEDGQLNMKI